MKYQVVGCNNLKQSSDGNPRLMLDLIDVETHQKIFEVPTKVDASFCYELMGRKTPYYIDAVVKEYYGRLQIMSVGTIQ